MAKTTNTAPKNDSAVTAAALVVETPTAPVASAKPAKAAVIPALANIGTPAALVAAGVKLNGMRLDVGTFAVLRKHHFNTAIKVNGYAEKPQGQKGKAAEIVELINAPGFEFTFASTQAA